MGRAFIRRLTALEKAVNLRPIHTQAEWEQTWKTLSALDKALFATEAENLAFLPDGHYKCYITAVAGYLAKARVLDPAGPTLQETAELMEAGRCE